jgi:heme-degrading monooxygenase HmoA
MIVRTWKCKATAANAGAYVEHLEGNVIPELRAIPGFRGALLLRDDREDGVEFLVLTRWANTQAIRTFAGDDIERAVVEAEAVAVLSSFDPTVRHYEVVDEVIMPE